MARRRLTREEQKAETRRRLLQAAAKVFARRGFHGASLELVAEEAGFTKGAVYSNFHSKEDLFGSLLEQRCHHSLEETREILAEPAPIARRMDRLGNHLAERTLNDPDWLPLFIAFWARSLYDARLRRRLAAIWEDMRTGIARLIEEQQLGHQAPVLPADQLAAAAMGLIDGLALQMLLDPAAVDRHTVGASLALLLRPEQRARGPVTMNVPSSGAHNLREQDS